MPDMSTSKIGERMDCFIGNSNILFYENSSTDISSAVVMFWDFLTLLLQILFFGALPQIKDDVEETSNISFVSQSMTAAQRYLFRLR